MPSLGKAAPIRKKDSELSNAALLRSWLGVRVDYGTEENVQDAVAGAHVPMCDVCLHLTCLPLNAMPKPQ